jgi:uncharacterized protein YcbK (DUF882 family)
MNTPAHLELFDSFAKIREIAGRPLTINSGFRCPKHNAEIGGEPLSVHLFGLALDIDGVNLSGAEELASIVNLVIPKLRMGVYKTFIHVDTGYHIIPRVLKEWHIEARWNG